MKSFREDLERVDDRRDEKPRLKHDLPHLIQIAVPQEEHARRQGEADRHGDERRAVGGERGQSRRRGRPAGRHDEHHDDQPEDGERNHGVRDRGHDQNPGRDACLGQQIPSRVQRRQAALGGFGEEIPQEQGDDEIELVGGIRREEEGEHAHQHDEHAHRLEQRPDEPAERAVVPGLEVGAHERPDQPGVGKRRTPADHAADGVSGDFHRLQIGIPVSSRTASELRAGTLRGIDGDRLEKVLPSLRPLPDLGEHLAHLHVADRVRRAEADGGPVLFEGLVPAPGVLQRLAEQQARAIVGRRQVHGLLPQRHRVRPHGIPQKSLRAECQHHEREPGPHDPPNPRYVRAVRYVVPARTGIRLQPDSHPTPQAGQSRRPPRETIRSWPGRPDARPSVPPGRAQPARTTARAPGRTRACRCSRASRNGARLQLSASRPPTTTMASQVRGSSRPTVVTSWKIAWPDGLIIIQR